MPAGPEQQALAFARLLLHKPRWVFVDEALDALAPATREAVFDIFQNELAAAALVCISGSKADRTFFTRVLRLARKPKGECLMVPPARLSQACLPESSLDRDFAALVDKARSVIRKL